MQTVIVPITDNKYKVKSLKAIVKSFSRIPGLDNLLEDRNCFVLQHGGVWFHLDPLYFSAHIAHRLLNFNFVQWRR